MGLLRELTVIPGLEGALVRMTIAVTEPGCLMCGSFAVEAEERVAALPCVRAVTVDIDHDADWRPSDMSPAYRLRLAGVRMANRQRLRSAAGITPQWTEIVPRPRKSRRMTGTVAARSDVDALLRVAGVSVGPRRP